MPLRDLRPSKYFFLSAAWTMLMAAAGGADPRTFETPSAPLEPIALDALPRQLPAGQKFACPHVEKARYAGTLMKISPVALVNDGHQPLK